VTPPRRIAIVGASAAGLTAAETLRNHGYDGSLTLIGAESHPPYDRPPLSKQILSGAWQPDRVALRDDQALAALDAELLLGTPAVGLDVADRRVLLADSRQVDFDGLVIATGVTPRRLPGPELAGVHLLRTLDDALGLRARLLTGPRVVVLGAGFLGTEVAAAARGMGLDVTVVDTQPVPLGRQVGERVGTLVGQLHADHGVSVRCAFGVRRLIDTAGHVTAVELADGTVLDADLVVVAIGATPAIDWLAGSGLPLGNGVECDEHCQAAPGIYAAGDVASWPNIHFGTRMRLEHRLNATEQAMAAARNLLGEHVSFAPVPYFWTDQYDTRIQVYGILPPTAEVSVIHGDLADRRFVVGYGHQGRLVGILGWNSPRQVSRLRRLLVDRTPWPLPAGSVEALAPVTTRV
jgi:NADPH-dependent 2,4-dienoyl-CoA reductase/sulfur reductase-like enzyme